MSPEELPLLPDGPLPGGAAAPFPGMCGPSHGTEPGPGQRLRLPLNIGHRGYKAAFPENSMAAFRGALAAGANVIETDLHLSRDGVVVLSHDATLKRCFGLNAKIADCDWSYLRTLQTVREPRQGMPRLSDLLEWLAEPGLELVCVLLDIKTDDDPELLLPAIARTIASVPSGPGPLTWKERIVVGAWNENYLTQSRTYLPGHPLTLISFSLLLARKILLSPDHTDVHFNLYQPSLIGPLGARFRKAARKRGRQVFAWTVNEVGWMEWCVEKGVDGVITDEVGRFEGVRKDFGAGDEPLGGTGDGSEGMVKRLGKGKRARVVKWPHRVKLYGRAMVMQAAAMLLTLLLWHRLNGKGGKRREPAGMTGPGKI